MEYMKVNNLSSIKKEYIESKGLIHDVLNPTIRSKIIFGVSAIMKKVHQKNIIFKELKIENIYLDDKLEPQINMLKTFPFRIEDFDIYFGTCDITPPEAFMNDDDEETTATDVYSFAFFLYIMFSNKIQFAGRPIRSNQRFMMKIAKGLRPTRPDNIPDPYWELIQMCWKEDPKERPTFEEITEILKSDRFAIKEFGMKTNLDDLHEYQSRIDDLE